MTAEKMSFVLIPKSWVFLFFLQIIITKSPRVIARLQKNACLSDVFVRHSKLKWKQDSGVNRKECQMQMQKYFFNTLHELLLLCDSILQRKCLEKCTIALLSTNGGHKELCGKYNWFHCTRYSILFYCFMYEKKEKKHCLQN